MTTRERAELIVGMHKQVQERFAGAFTYDDWIIYATQQIEAAEIEAKNRGIEEEREACAQIAEKVSDEIDNWQWPDRIRYEPTKAEVAALVAELIRARSS